MGNPKLPPLNHIYRLSILLQGGNAMTKKLILTASLAAILSMSTLFWAYGQERSITSVPLSFSWDGEPKGGELVGTVQADSSSKEFTVEGAEYTKRDDQWNYGEQPVAEVELSANTDRR